MNRPGITSLAGIGVVIAATCALYLPFLGNPMVFDDLTFFSGAGFSHWASAPFGFGLRRLPYFTLTFPQVLWGHFPPWHHAEIHRIITLAIHVACALVLYRLLLDLMPAMRGATGAPAAEGEATAGHLVATAGAVTFAIHPVAVYGVAYLAQRTILLATLFSLLSLVFVARGIARGRYTDAAVAALFYSLAVFSKEHSLPLVAVAVAAVLLLARDRAFAVRYAGLFLLACLPAILAVFAIRRSVVGNAYEPGFAMLRQQIEGIPALDIAGGPWLVSVITQAGLFFKYLALWLAPDISAMSIDTRIDFTADWTPAWIALRVATYAAFGVLGLILLVRRGRAGLVGFGMLYVWLLFAVEFAAAKFQEPFVLYRSYLWAPGIIIALAAPLTLLPRKGVLILLAAVVPVLAYQSYDRLRSFSSALALWEDAVAKLPPQPVPWGSRTLFGLAGEQVYTGQLDKAMQTAERCIAEYPETSYCYFSRGAVRLYRHEYDQALRDLDRSLAINPRSGIAHHHRGIVLEKFGRRDDARSAYRRSYELGFMGGLYRLGKLDGTDGKVLYDGLHTENKGK